ncbi:RnfH family protein [Methylomarinum vadi]|uniref:RnfH family protein n=1 Tax=Methylomarinum vadi TaxID=438855 RepID=UPI003898EE40
MAKSIQVEVAYAEQDRQVIVTLTVAEGTTLAEAIAESGMTQQFPHIDLNVNKAGIFGKICKLEQRLRDGDRVEIYRSLAQHPMDARRNRAAGR